jgi:hypothetical protein
MWTLCWTYLERTMHAKNQRRRPRIKIKDKVFELSLPNTKFRLRKRSTDYKERDCLRRPNCLQISKWFRPELIFLFWIAGFWMSDSAEPFFRTKLIRMVWFSFVFLIYIEWWCSMHFSLWISVTFFKYILSGDAPWSFHCECPWW